MRSLINQSRMTIKIGMQEKTEKIHLFPKEQTQILKGPMRIKKIKVQRNQEKRKRIEKTKDQIWMKRLNLYMKETQMN